MGIDIVPELLELIIKEFNGKTYKSAKLKKAIKKLMDNQADYKNANEFSIEIGGILAEVLGNNITSEILPDGKMYYNIADRILNQTMTNNFNLISGYTADVQTSLNHKAGLRMKAQKPKLNQSRIDGIVERLSKEDDFNKIKWILDEPITNFSQSIVDDTIKINTEFQAKAGLMPKITRREAGNCCDWCKEVVGTYTYPDVPENIYKRHRYCRCTVDYDPGDGKRKNVHSKEWIDPEKDDKIEARKKIGARKSVQRNSNGMPIDNIHPESVAGVKREKIAMTIDEANHGKPNPNFKKGGGYTINCQSCVVSYEARLRGYDVQTLPNTKGSKLAELSRKTNKAWIDLATGNHPEYIFDKTATTPKKFYEFMEKVIEKDKRYTLEFGWKGRSRSGHIISLDRDDKGILRLYDPQIGKTYSDKEVNKYLTNLKYTTKIYGNTVPTPPKILRVDDKAFDLDMVNHILEGVKE